MNQGDTSTSGPSGACPAGCAPRRGELAVAMLRARADAGTGAGALPPSDPAPEIAQARPEILLRPDPAWRRACLGQVAHIPSGYTYLAQLMGHDIGSTVLAETVPYARPAGALPDRPPLRYNLIDNPLTLETIYGPGPTFLAHVFDPETCLFRVTPGARLARLYARGQATLADPDPQPIRALYDERNRDSLMLHELAVAWMQYHNLIARPLLAAGLPPLRAYALARIHVTRCWHAILTGDLLARFLHPDIAALSATQLDPAWQLDENSLLHGLCRAFHALPLSAYHLGRSGLHNLGGLLRRGYGISDAETDWHIDWPLFFGQKPGGPLTGISASVAAEMRVPITAVSIMMLDAQSADHADPLRAGNAAMRQAIDALPTRWRRACTPATLATEFSARFPDAPAAVTPESLAWGPLFHFLMVEAHLHGQRGGFGPLGSALLRSSVKGIIDRVVMPPPAPETAAMPSPATMLELITLVRSNRSP
ncbi:MULTISPECIES: hypothetical protein [unclassified Paracoccus (in: a-proteobacteria)]|uniref:hypothetical protein n=1 Tax=unclassified Paracoccus (in: a-proteobacteria) TaxID=2688777 RepID=UPI0021E11395|nr:MULTISPECIES: hypothetical protein [unclassified Paracoccus (in: a-proteobacteria)]UXU76553.1 hypothetical protein GB879_014360 [Paracoccus sp. SMMA_5]UXU82380.1 hypothetical protein GB880_014075 [Paracoccus sp. SMMA_5_TC]